MHVTCPTLSAESGIRHGFFTRRGGVSTGLYAALNCGFGSGDDIKNVAENRAVVADTLGCPADSLCTAYQIHSAKAVILDAPWNWRDAPEADALVTHTPGIALGILTADCLPVLFSDSAHGVIAAAHAGWKGAIGGVIEATLESMMQLGAAIPAICASIGPAIAQGSYEVGEEFRDTFLAQDPGNKIYFVHGARAAHYQFDLKAYAKERLKSAGISRINVLAHDTCLQENDFFSYRRATLRGEPVYGRQVSAIALEKR